MSLLWSYEKDYRRSLPRKASDLPKNLTLGRNKIPPLPWPSPPPDGGEGEIAELGAALESSFGDGFTLE
jgi:hypothetical protein